MNQTDPPAAEAEPICKFEQGCHRVVACDPGCGAAPAVFPEPPSRAAVLRWAADELGRMDYDTDSQDYGYDTYRDAWNGGVMDGAEKLRRLAVEAHGTGTQQQAPDLAERKEQYAVAIHDAMESDLSLVDQEPGYQALFARAAEAAMTLADAEAQQQPGTEAEAAATLARECLDRAAVIRWCADRVRSTDGDYAVLAAAEYLDDLATEIDEAEEEPAPVAQQPAAEAPCCSDPTCTCVQVNAEGRCDCTKWGERPAPVQPAAADSEETRHTCGNCEGVDPDTCLTNPDRPAEPPV